MSRTEIDYENRDRFMQLGIAISTLRKSRGMSQEQLADRASISRSHLSAIEAPGMVRGVSLNTLFNIADALNISPSALVEASISIDNFIKKYTRIK